MTPRILILSIVDPCGRTGLEPAVHAIHALGGSALPVATGVITAPGGGAPRLHKTRARTLEPALRAALDEPLDGMLIELVPSFWQARMLARVLAESLPETMVFAPLAGGDTRRWLGPRSWAIQARAVVPEATTVVLPAVAGGDLVLGSSEAEPGTLARWALDAGAHSAWVLGSETSTRGIDIIAHGAESAVLDYPLSSRRRAPVRSLPAALAALLGAGLTLTEAIDGAHRFARDLGNENFNSVAR